MRSAQILSGIRGNAFERLRSEIVDTGLCSHCGTCVGLSKGTLQMRDTARGPLPSVVPGRIADVEPHAYDSCPGKGLNYPALSAFVFREQPVNWLVGHFRKIYLGYSNVPEIRRQAASGGVITQVLVHLMERGMITGAVVLRHGQPKPWLSEPVIATTVEELLAASQSVYVPTPVNTILGEIAAFNGTLAYVGLPDQVASLRRLQQLGSPSVSEVRYVIGPYCGTSIYLGAIESFLQSNRIRSLDEVIELRYREGTWPGMLRIKTRSGRILEARKFYYNYLTPFFITRSCLLSVDFTNELTDISVGDAWHPSLESKCEGYSVVVCRSEKGEELLMEMRRCNTVSLEEIPLSQALSMHGHMFDFKKRGSFIRIGWLNSLGLPAPDCGYTAVDIPFSRKVVEAVLSACLSICRTRMSRALLRLIPIAILGPLFDAFRRVWRRVSKPSKRKGLRELAFQIPPIADGAKE